MENVDVVNLWHELLKIERIDRTSFFGRLDILEWYCEKAHEAIGERWRKFGRYGNIVTPSALNEALMKMKTEISFTKEEFLQLAEWLEHQGTPDSCVAYVMMQHFVKEHF